MKRDQEAFAPAVAVLGAASLSWLAYELSPHIADRSVHELVARVSGTLCFVAVAFGPFYVYLISSLRNVSGLRRTAAALLTPLVWMAKECVVVGQSHPVVECLYYFLNPLHMTLLSAIVVELATATIVDRAIRRRRGESVRLRPAWPTAAIIAGMLPILLMYGAGRGEIAYAYYLAGYRALFTPVSVAGTRWPNLRDLAQGTRDFGDEDVARDTSARTGAAGEASRTPAGYRPNFVFILSDNHNAQTLGCAGHPVIKTPTLDRLASDGVRFTSAFNTTSLCSPSRASILTGTYAHTHGVLNNHTSWTGRLPTFLQRLSEAGYATAFIGKWHMPGEGLPRLPFLDLFVSYTYREGQCSYFDCPMIVNGSELPARHRYITEEITDYAIDFIEQNVARPPSERRPFIVYLSHRPGHPPYQAPTGIHGMYDASDVTTVLPPGVDSWWFGKTHGNVFQGTALGSYEDQYRGYLETLSAMDADIGRLLRRIDELGVTRTTAIIYMSDNGMQWGTHGMHGIREPYEDAAKVPLIVRAPWLVAGPGSLREQFALTIDIAPTILDIAGAAPLDQADGESLVPILKDRTTPGRPGFLMEYWRYFPENTPTYRAVRTRNAEYVEFERGRRPWLFDLAADPQQTRNLYGSALGAPLLPPLRRMLERLENGERR